MKLRFACALLVFSACGGASDRDCLAEDPSAGGSDCLAAALLAVRETRDVVPSQQEIEKAAQVYRAAYPLLPADFAHPPTPTSWYGPAMYVTARATNAAVVSAWESGRVQTGIAAVDDVLAAAAVESVASDGSDYYVLRSRRVLADANIASALSGVPDLEVFGDPVRPVEAFSEVSFEYPVDSEGIIDVLFSIGWGDCTVDCRGQHFWRVRVPDVGDPRLVDEFGDPVPAEAWVPWST